MDGWEEGEGGNRPSMEWSDGWPLRLAKQSGERGRDGRMDGWSKLHGCDMIRYMAVI